MNLNNVLNQIVNFEGYIYHRLRAVDHNGLVKCYTFWLQRNGELKDYEVRILVIGEGAPEEEAHVYSTKHINPSTAFRSLLESKIVEFQASNPAYEKVIVQSVNEPEEFARVQVFKYDSVAKQSTELSVIAFNMDGEVTLRICPQST